MNDLSQATSFAHFHDVCLHTCQMTLHYGTVATHFLLYVQSLQNRLFQHSILVN